MAKVNSLGCFGLVGTVGLPIKTNNGFFKVLQDLKLCHSQVVFQRGVNHMHAAKAPQNKIHDCLSALTYALL